MPMRQRATLALPAPVPAGGITGEIVRIEVHATALFGLAVRMALVLSGVAMAFSHSGG